VEDGFQIFFPQISDDFALVSSQQAEPGPGRSGSMSECLPTTVGCSVDAFFVHSGKHQGIKEQLIPTLATMISWALVYLSLDIQTPHEDR